MATSHNSVEGQFLPKIGAVFAERCSLLCLGGNLDCAGSFIWHYRHRGLLYLLDSAATFNHIPILHMQVPQAKSSAERQHRNSAG
jgi:hypothetical protein